jgi:hypothetical protein
MGYLKYSTRWHLLSAILAGIPALHAGITIDMVSVGDPGNPADQSYGTNLAVGSVGSVVEIGR